MDLETYRRLKQQDPTAPMGAMLGSTDVVDTRPSSMARNMAAGAWCTPATSNREMDCDLADAMAAILDRYIEALYWCGGSDDFAPGGQAHEGWKRLVVSLITEQ